MAHVVLPANDVDGGVPAHSVASMLAHEGVATITMDVGIVGLAGAGAILARRWACAGLRVAVFDRDGRTSPDEGTQGARALPSAVAVARSLAAPRVVWLCVPAGAATELAMQDVWPELAAGDVIVDAGDAHFDDAPRRAAALASVGIHFADCSVRDGDADAATVLLGGSAAAVRIVGPLARIAAGKGVYAHCGPAGAGHYVRMVNDGVERAVLQAFDEGAALLRGKREFGLDAARIADLLRAGRGANGWPAEPGVAGTAHRTTRSGYGVVNEAVSQRTPAPVLSLAAMFELGVVPTEPAAGPGHMAGTTLRAAGAADDKDDTT
jgi:6-phosphogluconate dehydrogenase